ncbi:hypothetical protein [Ferruginibacter sp. SUN106]|uniref:hypothetical protein n=1 Tax=Ferruginibacter sp. SUN106 TaxID=2978348 RepID=UPI003D3609BA
MMTCLSEDKAIQFACSTIHDFFDCYGLPDATWYWETIIKAAGNKKPWDKEAPYHLLLFMEKLQELCTAAVTISKDYTIHAAVVVKQPEKQPAPGILRQSDFVNSLQHGNGWSCFPRSLTIKQYQDPCKVIEKFAARMPVALCTKIIGDIQAYALSRNAIDGEYTSGQLLKIRLCLLQLIEACHLIEVRIQVLKKQGHGKQRRKK